MHMLLIKQWPLKKQTIQQKKNKSNLTSAALRKKKKNIVGKCAGLTENELQN